MQKEDIKEDMEVELTEDVGNQVHSAKKGEKGKVFSVNNESGTNCICVHFSHGRTIWCNPSQLKA